MTMDDYEKKRQQLVNFAQDIKWDQKDRLFHIENAFSDEFWISTFTQTQFKRGDVIRYLMLTSLPYIIMEDETTDIDAKITAVREILKEFWKLNNLTPALSRPVELPDELSLEPTMPIGNFIPKYFVIGDAPGMCTEKDPYTHFGRVFTRGPSSMMIRLATIHAGIYFKCWFTNLSKLAMFGNKPTTEAVILNQKEYLDFELQTLKPEAIIVLGSHAANQLKKYYQLNIPIIQVTHPSYMARMSGKQQAFDNTKTRYTFQEYGDGIKTAIEFNLGKIL